MRWSDDRANLTTSREYLVSIHTPFFTDFIDPVIAFTICTWFEHLPIQSSKEANAMRAPATTITLLLTMSASCGVDDDRSVRLVVEANPLGVNSVAIERESGKHNTVFTLRAFSVDDNEVAFVRRTTGEVAGLSRWENTNVGTELVISVYGRESKSFTTEIGEMDFAIDGLPDPNMKELVSIPTVWTMLSRDGKVFFERLTVAEVPYRLECQVQPQSGDWSAYSHLCPDVDPPQEPPQPSSWVRNCDPSELQAGRSVKQCCTMTNNSGTAMFLIPPGLVNGFETTSLRKLSPYGACKGRSGEFCLGQGCYYGPNRWSRETYTVGDASAPFAWVVKSSDANGESCWGTQTAARQPAYFADHPSGGSLQEGVCACGDGSCNYGETSSTCSQDCGPPPDVCGNGTCGPTEDQYNCPSDCGYPSVCSNGICEAGEDQWNCPSDCGSCSPGVQCEIQPQ